MSTDMIEKTNDERHIVTPRKDLTGRVFGTLKVLGLSDRLGSRGKRLVPLWECECACGEITYKATDTLTNKDRNSCAECAKDYAVGKLREGAGYQDGTQISRIKDVQKESGNLSGVRGVYYENGRYRARLKFKGKLYNFGSFENLADAVRAREDGEKKIYGAYFNGPSLMERLEAAQREAAEQGAESGARTKDTIQDKFFRIKDYTTR